MATPLWKAMFETPHFSGNSHPLRFQLEKSSCSITKGKGLNMNTTAPRYSIVGYHRATYASLIIPIPILCDGFSLFAFPFLLVCFLAFFVLLRLLSFPSLDLLAFFFALRLLSSSLVLVSELSELMEESESYSLDMEEESSSESLLCLLW